MTIRLLTHVPRDAKPAMRCLQELAKDDLEIVFELGDGDADIKGSTLSRMSTQRGKSGHLLSGTSFTGMRHSVISSPDYVEDMERFLDHLQRTGPASKYRSHHLQSLQDYTDYYHILTDVVADRILKSGATHMLFFNIPHMAYDTIFYQVGLQLGLKPVVLLQSLFPGRFFSMQGPTDFGHFDPSQTKAAPYPIENGSSLDLFYMKKIKQGEQETGKISLRAIANLFAYIVTKDPAKALNPVWMVRTLQRMKAVYGAFPKWRDPFAKFFHTNDLAYFEHLAEFEQNPVDLDQKFIYFAMQLQPEMTTSALGHKYRDQALAIEDLARILPPDVKIYVKENPKQLGFARGPMFFHRLSRIPAVRMMPSYADTHSLTDAAMAVATISGTVGWEAICKNKPAICFGDTWYQKLPGVLRFDEQTSWDDIENLSVDHAKLEAAAGALIARSHKGSLHRYYSRNLPDFEESQNAEDVARTILGLLTDEVELTFPPASART